MAKSPTIWKFSAGHTGGIGFWEDFYKNDRVAWSHSPDLDLSDIKYYEDVEKLMYKTHSSITIRQYMDFLSMEKGDLVVCFLRSSGSRPPKLMGVGYVEDGIYHFSEEKLDNGWPYPHQKSILWLKNFKEINLTHYPDIYRALAMPQDTIHRIVDEGVKKIILSWVDDYITGHATEAEEVKKLFGPPKRKRTLIKPQIVKISRGSVIGTSTIDESATWGMERALAYEEAQGRDPKDVSTITKGYDIESSDKTGKVVRNIEVKARRSTIPVTLTKNEYRGAERLSDDYYLYVITNDTSGKEIRNPVKKCLLKKKYVVVYEVTDWEEKGENMDIPK